MTNVVTPRESRRPLYWPDAIFDLRDALADYAQPIYIVGGAVRDAYLSRPIYDLDLIVPEDAIGLARHITNLYNGDIFIMDRDRDVARVFIDLPAKMESAVPQPSTLMIDVARFRGVDLLADLHDRDFTFNAMAVELKDDLALIIDPLDGETDLVGKIIRRCSDHALTDDPVRALRAIRQSIQYDARIEPETLKDIRAAAPLLENPSPERVRDEFIKLLGSKRPAGALRVADALDLLTVIIPEVHLLKDQNLWDHTLTVIDKLNMLLTVISPNRTDATAATFEFGMAVVALDPMRPELQDHIAQRWPNDRSHWVMLFLAALLHQVFDSPAKSALAAAERAVALRLSNEEKKRIQTTLSGLNTLYALPDSLTDLDIHRYWYTLGEAGVDVCLLALADYLGTVGTELNQDTWLAVLDRTQTLVASYFRRYDEVVMPPQLVDGNDLMQTLDLEPGKVIKTLLDLIREGQVKKEITTQDDAFSIARDYLLNHKH